MSDFIGSHVAGYSSKYSRTQIYVCTAADDDNVLIHNIADLEETKALSPRAIRRTYMPAKQLEDGRWDAYMWGLLEIVPPGVERANAL